MAMPSQSRHRYDRAALGVCTLADCRSQTLVRKLSDKCHLIVQINSSFCYIRMYHGLLSSSAYPTVLVMNRQHCKVLKMQMLTVSTKVRLKTELDMGKISDCSVIKHRAKRVKLCTFIPSSTNGGRNKNGVPVCLGCCLHVNVLLQCAAASMHILSPLYLFHPSVRITTCQYYQ